GSNFHLVLEEASAEKTAIDWTGDIELIAFGANDSRSLKAKLGEVLASSPRSWPELHAFADRTRREFAAGSAYRAVLVVRRHADVSAIVQRAVKAIDEGCDSSGDGFHVGQGKPGKLAVLFPGQGAQYAGMLRDLACHFPSAFSVLGKNADVAEMIYP